MMKCSSCKVISYKIATCICMYYEFQTFSDGCKKRLPEGEVYVDQSPCFLDYEHPNYVYKLKKALYGSKQAPRPWYGRLSSFLIEQSFTSSQVDKTLFIKKVKNYLLIVQIYVDDIIFGSTNETLCKEFSCCMQKEFEMSMMGELNFFLGLQAMDLKHGTFLNQTKYRIELIKKIAKKHLLIWLHQPTLTQMRKVKQWMNQDSEV